MPLFFGWECLLFARSWEGLVEILSTPPPLEGPPHSPDYPPLPGTLKSLPQVPATGERQSSFFLSPPPFLGDILDASFRPPRHPPSIHLSVSGYFYLSAAARSDTIPFPVSRVISPSFFVGGFVPFLSPPDKGWVPSTTVASIFPYPFFYERTSRTLKFLGRTRKAAGESWWRISFLGFP